jgi:hypothetical protein
LFALNNLTAITTNCNFNETEAYTKIAELNETLRQLDEPKREPKSFEVSDLEEYLPLMIITCTNVVVLLISLIIMCNLCKKKATMKNQKSVKTVEKNPSNAWPDVDDIYQNM